VTSFNGNNISRKSTLFRDDNIEAHHGDASTSRHRVAIDFRGGATNNGLDYRQPSRPQSISGGCRRRLLPCTDAVCSGHSIVRQSSMYDGTNCNIEDSNNNSNNNNHNSSSSSNNNNNCSSITKKMQSYHDLQSDDPSTLIRGGRFMSSMMMSAGPNGTLPMYAERNIDLQHGRVETSQSEFERSMNSRLGREAAALSYAALSDDVTANAFVTSSSLSAGRMHNDGKAATSHGRETVHDDILRHHHHQQHHRRHGLMPQSAGALPASIPPCLPGLLTSTTTMQPPNQDSLHPRPSTAWNSSAAAFGVQLAFQTWLRATLAAAAAVNGGAPNAAAAAAMTLNRFPLPAMGASRNATEAEDTMSCQEHIDVVGDGNEVQPSSSLTTACAESSVEINQRTNDQSNNISPPSTPHKQPETRSRSSFMDEDDEQDNRMLTAVHSPISSVDDLEKDGLADLERSSTLSTCSSSSFSTELSVVSANENETDETVGCGQQRSVEMSGDEADCTGNDGIEQEESQDE